MPYSLIELAEDALMVVLGSVLILGATGAADGARRAAIAAFISYVFSFIVSLAWYFKKGGRLVNPKKQLGPLLSSSLPVTAMRTSSTLINSLVAVLLPLMLVKMCGLGDSEAISLYGVAAGMSVPILFIPSSLIGSINVVLAPELSENFYRNRTERLKEDVEKSLRAALLIAFMIIPVLFALGGAIGEALFSDGLCGEIVSAGSIILLPMCLSMITNTILNSMNREKVTLVYYFAGAAAMLACMAALMPLIGVYSYVAGLGASFVITAALNMRLLKKLVRGVKIFGYFVKCAAACALCCAFGYLVSGATDGLLPPLLQLVVCGAALGAFIVIAFVGLKLCPVKPLKAMFARKRTKRRGAVK